MKRILVPCDFTASSQQAYKFAVDLSEKSQGVVEVVRIFDIPFLYETAFGIQPYWQNAAIFPALLEEAKVSFKALQGMLPARHERISFSVERGPVSSTIHRLIEEKEIDLVIMGVKGSRGAAGFFVGSNTERIVRSSRVPVFSIHKSPDLVTIRNIVYPTLPESNPARIHDEVRRLQTFFGAAVHFVRINTPANFMPDSEAKRALERVARAHNFSNASLSIRSDTYEQDGIVRFATEVKADMIAMATHGRKGIAHFFTGSIAEDVLHKITFPIWTSVI